MTQELINTLEDKVVFWRSFFFGLLMLTLIGLGACLTLMNQKDKVIDFQKTELKILEKILHEEKN